MTRLQTLAQIEQLFNVTVDAETIQAYLDGRITVRQLVWAILSPEDK